MTLFLLVEASECSGLISLNQVVFSFKIYFSFPFCSHFNLEARVVKRDEIKHGVHSPFMLGRGRSSASYQIFNKGEAWQDLFLEEACWEREG